jgi:DNA end-binding protein Ku
MSEAGVIAIARVVLRSRERLVAIRPLEDGVLSMEALHYASEVRDVPDEDLETLSGKPPSKREIEMARSLVDELTVTFDPSAYHDTWYEQVMERVEEKASGESITAPEAPATEPTPATDIMAALEASLAAARKQRSPSSKTKPKPKKKTKAKAKA